MHCLIQSILIIDEASAVEELSRVPVGKLFQIHDAVAAIDGYGEVLHGALADVTRQLLEVVVFSGRQPDDGVAQNDTAEI
jgi:hypothetical protein